MIKTIIVYFLIIVVVPIFGSISSYIIAPLFFLKNVLRGSFLLFLSGFVNGFVSIWLGIKILNLFNKEAGLVMILIVLSVFIYHYTKDSFPRKDTDNSLHEIKDLMEGINNQNMAILLGNITGLVISSILFIY